MLDIPVKTHLQVSTWRVKENTHNCMGCMAFPFHVINVMVSHVVEFDVSA